MATATNWVTLTGADIRRVINAGSQEDPNQNLADTVKDGDELVMTEANRRDECVADAIRTVRGAIAAGARVPVSVTPNAVPPEGVWHTLVIAAYRLVSSTPGLVKFLMAGDGEVSPLSRMYAEAQRWLYGDPRNPKAYPGLAAGANTTYPTDPVGRDGVNEVDTDNPLYEAVRVGSVGDIDEADLTTFGTQPLPAGG